MRAGAPAATAPADPPVPGPAPSPGIEGSPVSSRPPEPTPPPDPPDGTRIVRPSEIVRRLGKLTVFRNDGRTMRVETTGPADAADDDGTGFPNNVLPAERYEILGEFARGGMGVVLRARDRVIGRELAVKVPAADDWGRVAESRFLREARITGQLQHPGVVPVYDVGRFPDGRPFMAMRLVRGKCLDFLLTSRPDPRHGVDHWLRTAESVCQTVAYAHSKGVIHRDLKPHNVVVAGCGHTWVLDWGLAKVLHEDDDPADAIGEPPVRGSGAGHTDHGAALGTPGYMAPEQARGDAGVDERADVFALGALLCQVLTGLPPFAHPDRIETWERNENGDVADALARLAACGADPRLVELTGHCLSPDPAGRPRDARQLAAALADLLTERPCRCRG
jgi:serine/threonine protein kinase